MDLERLRKRAQDYIDSFGASNWASDDDVWIDMLRPTAGPQGAVLMGRFMFAVSTDAISAIIDALVEQRTDSTQTKAS